MPSRFLLGVLRLSIAAFLVFIVTRTSADPDLWGHVLFGRDIVQAGRVPLLDPYSFTADKGWINHEWLSEVLMYLAYAAGGSIGLVALKTALMLGVLGTVLVVLRASSIPPVIHDLLLFLAVAGMWPRAAVFRPQVFSLALFSALLLTLVAAQRNHRPRLLAIPPIFLIWANVHGGWIVGLAVFTIWALCTVCASDQSPSDRAWVLMMAVFAPLATLVNPYGWHLWTFLIDTVGLSRSDIADWQPLWKVPPGMLIPWVTAGALAVLSTRSHLRINPAHALIVALSGVGSLWVSRLDAFFVLAVVMLLAPHIGASYQRIRRQQHTLSESSRPTPRLRMAMLASIAIGAGIVAGRGNFQCIDMGRGWSPPESGLVQLIRDRGVQGRILIYFDWGEYAIWHTAPGTQVSIDGRRETVYSDRVIANHVKVYLNQPEAKEIIGMMKPDYVWLPTPAGILGRLERDGWLLIFRGPTSTLLAANALTSSPATTLLAGVSQPRCFPGP